MKANKTELVANDFVIRAKGVSKTFGVHTALRDVNLDIQKNSVTAILGTNGAGKTTFIHCCLGLTKPSRGNLSIFGKKPGSMESRRRVGVMLQDADLPDLLTPREHIALFASYYPSPLPLANVLDICNLEGFATKKYKALSGGQKRRVQFALAIIGNPDLIFLDEPTTGLDTEARRMVWEVIRRLANEGRTIVLTTHYLEEADALSDRIVVLDAGNVIANAPTAEIQALAGGAMIKCVTDIPPKDIGKMPKVVSVRHNGRFTEINTQDSPSTLRALLSEDANLSELIVKKPSLEEAFDQLTHSQKKKS